MDTIAVLDFGSQYSHLIANRIRRQGVYTEIFEPEVPLEQLKGFKGIILSGGPQSVNNEDSPKADPAIFKLGIPVLGICYGFQYMAHNLDGKVTPGDVKEYGRAHIEIKDSDNLLLRGLSSKEQVWMSHWDTVSAIPGTAKVIASSSDCENAAVDFGNNLYGIQFHPEVVHTPHGMQILSNFIKLTGAKSEWSIEKFIEEKLEEIKQQGGEK